MSFDRPFPGSNEGSGQIVTAGDLTGTVTSLAMDLSGIRQLTLTIAVTRPAGGVTAVQMFQDILRGGDPHALQDLEETATPVKTLDDEQADKAIPGAGTTRWAIILDVASIPDLQLRFTATGGVAGDVIDVFADGAG